MAFMKTMQNKQNQAKQFALKTLQRGPPQLPESGHWGAHTLMYGAPIAMALMEY